MIRNGRIAYTNTWKLYLKECKKMFDLRLIEAKFKITAQSYWLEIRFVTVKEIEGFC